MYIYSPVMHWVILDFWTGPGYLAMANSGVDTNKSQFYVTFVKAEWLDEHATVFGKVTQL